LASLTLHLAFFFFVFFAVAGALLFLERLPFFVWEDLLLLADLPLRVSL
jgi:hypothetical protein